MVLPLQIDFDDRLKLADQVPFGVSMQQRLEFGFIVENEDGTLDVLTPEEFACHSAACRPPTSGGTGGSVPSGGFASSTHYAPKPGYVGEAEQGSDLNVVLKGGKGGTTLDDGRLSESFLGSDGSVNLTAKQEKVADEALEAMGTSYAELKANAKDIALRSMDNDPEQAVRDSQWYQREHDTWGEPLAREHNITVEQVMGIAAVTSTNKTWDGVKSSNKEVVGTILSLLKEDRKITITKEQADAYNQFSIDKPSGGGKYGPKTIEPGEYRMSQLSSGTLARVMGSGYNIGGQYFTDGLFKAFSIARGEMSVNSAVPSLKQRSFINNLAHPEKDYSVTNDFWQVRALLGTKPLNLIKDRPAMTVRAWEKETAEKPNSFIGTRGTGTKNLYAYMTKATREALDELVASDVRFSGMKAHELQALMWVQMQREY